MVFADDCMLCTHSYHDEMLNFTSVKKKKTLKLMYIYFRMV